MVHAGIYSQRGKESFGYAGVTIKFGEMPDCEVQGKFDGSKLSKKFSEC